MKNQKVVIITGASSGIGLACAYQYAQSGYKTVMCARRIDLLQTISNDLNNLGFDTYAVMADVSKEDDCNSLINKTIEKYGQIDILINNAGISMRAMFTDLSLNVIKRVMDVNFWGTVYCTKYALPYLLKTNGTVVGVSSITGFVGLPGRTGYAASKYAMHGFLETLRMEHLKSGLNVMIVAPGFTNSNIRKKALVADGTEQGKTPRDESKMMSSEEVAKRIYKGVNNKRRTLILTMQGKLLVALTRFWPSLIDRLVYKTMSKEINPPFK